MTQGKKYTKHGMNYQPTRGGSKVVSKGTTKGNNPYTSWQGKNYRKKQSYSGRKVTNKGTGKWKSMKITKVITWRN